VAWRCITIQPFPLNWRLQCEQRSVMLGEWGPLDLLSFAHVTLPHPFTLPVPTCFAMRYGLAAVLVPLPVPHNGLVLVNRPLRDP
jgi:hypothetical protein